MRSGTVPLEILLLLTFNWFSHYLLANAKRIILSTGIIENDENIRTNREYFGVEVFFPKSQKLPRHCRNDGDD